MSKKSIILIVVFAMLAIVVIVAMLVHRRQRSEILMELVIWPGGGGRRGRQIHYYVVHNDGTLTRFIGRNRFHRDNIRPGNPTIPILRERTRVILSEEEFRRISRLVDSIVSGPGTETVISHTRAVFSHNGNIYFNSTGWSRPVTDLIRILERLTS